MKKILTLILALIFALSLCACGNTSKDDKNGASQTSTGNSDSTGSQGTGYVGTWKAIAPDSNPFPTLYMVLNEDGTAGWGAKLENLKPYFWYESESDDAKEKQMELAREDNMGYGNNFYLTEDGRIYMEINLSVGDNSYDHIYFERQ